MVLELRRVMRFPSSSEVVDIWTIAGSLSDTLSAGSHWLSLVILGYLMITLFGRDCRRFFQMAGKIIANAQTISHMLES